MKRLSAFVAVCLFSPFMAAAAALLNTGFESGDLAGWAGFGDTSATGIGFGAGPVEGSFEALLTTANDSVDGFSFSGFDALSVGALESALALPAGVLSNFGGFGTFLEGSAIVQEFSVTTAAQLSFAWNFLTDERAGSAGSDGAFVLLDDKVFLLADTSAPRLGSATPFLSETGFDRRSIGFSPGTHRIAFGVLDQGDQIGVSGLLVDDIVLVQEPAPTPAPEPGALLLLGMGLVGLGIARMFHRDRSPAIPEAKSVITCGNPG